LIIGRCIMNKFIRFMRLVVKEPRDTWRIIAVLVILFLAVISMPREKNTHIPSAETPKEKI